MRDRDGDVERLVRHFNAVLSARHDVPPRRFGADVMRLLNGYQWPGNVRELRNLVESQLLLADQVEVSLEELAAELPIGSFTTQAQIHGSTLQAAEREAIADAIRACSGNLTAAARSLGVSRSTLYRKMETSRM